MALSRSIDPATRSSSNSSSTFTTRFFARIPEWVARDLFRERYRANAESISRHVYDPAHIGCLLLSTPHERLAGRLDRTPVGRGRRAFECQYNHCVWARFAKAQNFSVLCMWPNIAAVPAPTKLFPFTSKIPVSVWDGKSDTARVPWCHAHACVCMMNNVLPHAGCHAHACLGMMNAYCYLRGRTAHATAFDFHSAFGDQLHGLGISLAFGSEIRARQACRACRRRVTGTVFCRITGPWSY